MAKRKRSSVANASAGVSDVASLATLSNGATSKAKRTKKTNQEDDGTILETPNTEKPAVEEKRPHQKKGFEEQKADPEADSGDEDADPEEVHAASLRPPPVNSDYLPLPWKGRLGYACLNTYLRNSVPPVFSSRTTRIASILEHRHPLADPLQPEHAVKNRPDKEKPADVRRGQDFIAQLCLANVQDMAKMIRWNDRYGIKFMRLSSEAFPFASHAEYGYKLAPFAAEELEKVGKVAAELGHRLTTHPGQFTQLGSPRQNVIDASIRDLDYHSEMLSLLKLPPQQDRDAVMILHMGGVFGDKQATLDRFRQNYAALSENVKKRLVLENDDMSWSVHDLLPICQELNIPFVLDFHHHNIIFDPEKIREGTHGIRELYPAILETWKRKNITPKMHYSEPTPAAITGTQRRKHNPRPATLPPCPNDMDLMIEAKDKEQAVFELMRTFKLPGWNTFNNIVPHVRDDINKPAPRIKATPKKRATKKGNDEEDFDEEAEVNGSGTAGVESDAGTSVPDHEVGMGGPLGRVYWPPGMEDWLRPVKRVVKKKVPEEGIGGKMTPAQRKAIVAQAKAEIAAEMKAKREANEDRVPEMDEASVNGNDEKSAKSTPAKPKKQTKPKTKATAKVEVSDERAEEVLAQADEEIKPSRGRAAKLSRDRGSVRASRAPRKSYKETDGEEDDE